MTTLTPTHGTGATSMPADMVYVLPGRAVSEEAMRARAGQTGDLEVPFLLGHLSMMLAHERCGRHLYRSVAGRTLNPLLRRKYEQFGEETERHVERLGRIVSALGGDPQYVSPAARATEKTDTALVESTFLLRGSVDVMTAESVMLNAVFVAEAVDHANWQFLAAIAGELPEGEVRDLVEEIVGEARSEEDDHLGWATDMRLRMARLQAEHGAVATAGMKVEELAARVRSWFE